MQLASGGRKGTEDGRQAPGELVVFVMVLVLISHPLTPQLRGLGSLYLASTGQVRHWQ